MNFKNFKKDKSVSTSEDDVVSLDNFTEKVANLCMSKKMADIIFKIHGEYIWAHRFVLATQSEYFRSMLYGGGKEAMEREIHLDVPVGPFKNILVYIYCGKLDLDVLDVQNLVDTLYLTNQYNLDALKLQIARYLEKNLIKYDIRSVTSIMETARACEFDALKKGCLNLIQKNSNDFLQKTQLKDMSIESLAELLAMGPFGTPEVERVKIIIKWLKYNTDADPRPLISLVRLCLCNVESLLKIVKPSGLFSDDQIDQAILERFRCQKNVATDKSGAMVIHGHYRPCLLDDDLEMIPTNEEEWSFHVITKNETEGLIIKLGAPSYINHIKFLLPKTYNASYLVEVSNDGENWDCVVDFRMYYCVSWQFIYFTIRQVRYIKIFGICGSDGEIEKFHVIKLYATMVEPYPYLVKGFVVPAENVATSKLGATVTGEKSRILGDGEKIWNSDKHISDENIIVRLGQPYYIDTIRIFLNTLHSTNSFDMEIFVCSIYGEWVLIGDCQERHLGWKSYVFPARPVIFVKLHFIHNESCSILDVYCANDYSHQI